MKNWITNLIIFAFLVAIVLIIASISTKDMTSNEATLLSVLLTILSVIASWILSSYFSKQSHKQAIEEVRREYHDNLRTYALNAAEKVDNLSNELSRLSGYLRAELESDEESDERELLSKTVRIESCIHIIDTLKSVNDTSLSDWKGVIGDELEEREEEKEERETRLLLLTERIEDLINSQTSSKEKYSKTDLSKIMEQLDKLSKSINSPISPIRTSTNKPRKEKVETDCPNCHQKISYFQRSKANSCKTVTCSKCGKRYISKFNEEKGPSLIDEKIIEEAVQCPWCSETIEVKLSNIPFTKEVIRCDTCLNEIKLLRNNDFGISLSKLANQNTQEEIFIKQEIDDELLDLVANKLPPQPWPTAIHRIIAEKLTISNGLAYRCITKLIEQGKVNPQFNGVVYVKSDLKRE
ncbi:MAG: hypothetical protein Q8N38_03560 [Bacteroidales bacterium]|nr:hypothetical protein [Bacteroidales bacterium]